VIGEEAGVMTKFLVLFLIGLVGIVTYRTLSGKSKRPDEESAPWDEPPPDLMSDDVSPQMLDLTFPVAASPVIDAGISTSTVASTDPSGIAGTAITDFAVAAHAPPVPDTGLPQGWTMEQWKYYGKSWLEDNAAQIGIADDGELDI
jgi:hypothetical protein